MPLGEDLVLLVGAFINLLRCWIIMNVTDRAEDPYIRDKIALHAGKSAIPDSVLREIQVRSECLDR